MFPGQGSQYRRMGEKLFPLFPEYCKLADFLLGYSIEELCLEDANRNINKTSFTQSAVFFVSCLTYLHAIQTGIKKPDLLLGHSLGLFSALFAAGVFDLETGLNIVITRGQLMESASDGAMLAVIGQGVEELPELLIQHQITEIDIANLNTPTQAVLSGKKKPIQDIQRILEVENFKCIPLFVSGPFHSRYMDSVREKFTQFLMGISLNKPSIPIISTTNAEVLSEHFLYEEMSFQLIKPVRWSHTIKGLLTKYPSIQFKEIGPGNVLEGLNRQIIQTVI